MPAVRLLQAMVDHRGQGPLPWIAAPVAGADRVLDLCCGGGALAPFLAPGQWLGVDPGSGPHRPRLRGAPTAIPLRDNAVDGVTVLLALPHLPDLDAVFAEIRRVLVPGGTLVLLVPSGSMRSVAEFRAARLLRPVRGGAWTNRSALDSAGWLLQAADFAVLGDDRVAFTLPLPDAAGLPRSGLWPPGVPAAVLAAVTASGRPLPIPMRRLVARR
jgi:SAM-dependent methyltransferase